MSGKKRSEWLLKRLSAEPWDVWPEYYTVVHDAQGCGRPLQRIGHERFRCASCQVNTSCIDFKYTGPDLTSPDQLPVLEGILTHPLCRLAQLEAQLMPTAISVGVASK